MALQPSSGFLLERKSVQIHFASVSTMEWQVMFRQEKSLSDHKIMHIVVSGMKQGRCVERYSQCTW